MYHLKFKVIFLSFFFFPLISQAQTLEGTFSKVISHLTNGSSQVEYYLETKDLDVFKLDLSKIATKDFPASEDFVSLDGLMTGENEFAVERIYNIQVQKEKPQMKTSESNKRSLVVLKTVNSRCAQFNLEESLNNLKKDFKRVSSNKFYFDSDLNQNGSPNFFEVDYSEQNSVCNFAKDKAFATKFVRDLLKRDGSLNVTDNYHIAFIGDFQECTFTGKADLPGYYTQIVNHCAHHPLFVHELGHNLNLHHAAFDKNKNNKIDGAIETYGDPFSAMGKLVARELTGVAKFPDEDMIFNPVELYKLGWVNGKVYDIKPDNKEVHKLYKFNDFSNNSSPDLRTKAIRVVMPKTDYFISFTHDNYDREKLQVHFDSRVYDNEQFGSVYINSIKERQSLALAPNLWVTFLKREINQANDITISFKLSEQRPKGFAAGIGNKISVKNNVFPFRDLYSSLSANFSSDQHLAWEKFTLFHPFRTLDEEYDLREFPNVQIGENNQIGFYFQDGTSKFAQMKKYPLGALIKSTVTLPNSINSLTEGVGEVVRFTKEDEIYSLVIRNYYLYDASNGQKTTVLGLTLYAPDSEIIYSKISLNDQIVYLDAPVGYFKLTRNNKNQGELVYSPSSFNDTRSPEIDLNSYCIGYLENGICQLGERLFILSAFLRNINSSECVDSDGDGWGWNGQKSCRVEAECIDSDGDGWGWDGSKSCKVN